MNEPKKTSISKQRSKSASCEATDHPYFKLRNALSGFKGWKLPPLNPRVDTNDNK